MSAAGFDLDAEELKQLNTTTLRTLCNRKGIDPSGLTKKDHMINALLQKEPQPRNNSNKKQGRGRGRGKAKKSNQRNVRIQEPPVNPALEEHKRKNNENSGNKKKSKKQNKKERDESLDLFEYDNVYFGDLDELADEVNKTEGVKIITIKVIKQIKKQWIKRDVFEKMILSDDSKLYSLMSLPIGVVQAFQRHFNEMNPKHSHANDTDAKSSSDDIALIQFEQNYPAFEAYLYEDKYSDLKVFGTKNDYHDAKLGRNTKLVIVIGRMTHSERWKSWVECVYTIKQFMVEYKNKGRWKRRDIQSYMPKSITFDQTAITRNHYRTGD
eukprot:1047168_1